VYNSKQKDAGVMTFNTTLTGEYTIVFSNPGNMEKIVYFAFHAENEEKEDTELYDIKDGERITKDRTDFEIEVAVAEVDEIKKKNEEYKEKVGHLIDVASEEELELTRRTIGKIHRATTGIAEQVHLSQLRQEQHNEDVRERGKTQVYVALGELGFFIVVIFIGQYFLKRSLDNKLVM